MLTVGSYSEFPSRTVRLRALCGLIILLALAGCASPLPLPLQQDPPRAPDFRTVQSDPQAYRGAAVRWGGTVIRLDNRASDSELEVLARPLDGNGRPRAEGPALGRFIARSREFLDPAVYKIDSEITLSGALATPVTYPIGDYSYTYPVVTTDALYVWAPRPVYREPPPYWYDPWYPWGYPYWWKHPYHAHP